ncbi:MAG: ABC transporter permease [Saprospiraceae bacterium]|nr:MAG: ABC transporter permease [Saprospiraceae bacterium]
MRIVLLLIQKELKQVVRNRAMLPILFVFPVIQLVILSFAATHDIKNIKLAVADYDHSESSRTLINKLTASEYFILKGTPQSDGGAFDFLQNGQADAVLTIPPHFERDVMRRQPVSLQFEVNAINGQKAGLAASYAGQVFQSFGRQVAEEWQLRFVNAAASPPSIVRPLAAIETTSSYWYNPELDYKTFMVPGILGELVAMLVLILSAMNVVREKELGTIEQINVSPIRKWQFISGKLLPFLLIGLFDLALGLTAGKLLFDIPIVGSLWVVVAFCVVNIFYVLGIGFFISNFAGTQQQAMFIAWFFMVIFILMSGLFTPIESMPEWAQAMTVPNPIAHFVEVMRMVLLKGSSWADVRYNFLVMIGLGVLMNGLAVWTYRKRVG